MALSIEVQPGHQFAPNERMNRTTLNQLGRPTINLIGTLSGQAIGDHTITGDKLSPTLIADITPADPTRDDLVMFQDITAHALAQCTIGKLLDLSTPSLELTPTVTLNDLAWIIQADNKNRKATVADVLREAINGQLELAVPTDIDATADTMLLFDNNAPANTNKNRKVKVKTVVRSATNTLIADTTPLVGVVDPNLDEVLLRDVDQVAGDQQRRLTVKALLQQVAGIKAWANFNGTTGAIRGSNNIASVTRTKAGYYTVTLIDPVIDANYAVIGTSSQPAESGNTGIIFHLNTNVPMTASSFGCMTRDDDGSAKDAPLVSIMVIR